MSPSKVGIGQGEDLTGVGGIGRGRAVTGNGTQRGGGATGGGGHKRARNGLRLRISAIPGRTPKKILRTPLYIPCVLGPDFGPEDSALHSEFDTVSAGQFSSPAGGEHAPQLKSLSFDALTLTWDAKWLVYPEVTPAEVREELDAILDSRKPVELFAFLAPHGGRAELRMDATLRSLNRILRHGETDTRYYSLEWKEWRAVSISREGANGYGNLPTTHELEKDDTLRSIASEYYGAGTMWEFLASSNGISSWGSEDELVKLNRFKAGDKIKVPLPPPTKVGGAQSLTGSDNHLRISGG